MKNIILIFIVFLSIFTTALLYAYDGITLYGTEITSKDRYNSSGERLKTVRAILRQDRANFHQFGLKDTYDQNDNFFASKSNREIFDTAKITISPALANKIINGGDVLIGVYVLTRDHIDVQPGLPNPNAD